MSDNIQTQSSVEVQSVTVDDLSKKVQDTTKELNQLKNGLNIYTIEEQDRRLSEIEDSILDCNQDLKRLETETLSNSDKEELKKLKSKIDALKSSKDQVKQQIERETKTAMDALSQEVSQSKSQEDSEKSDKKKETGKKILRVVGGIGIVAGTVALCKRIFGKKEKENTGDGERKEETKEEKKEKRKEKRQEFRQRPFGKFLKRAGAVLGIGSGIYYLAHGLYTKNWSPRDIFDWEKGKKLDFDAALQYCKGAIANQDNNEGMSYGLDLDYDESTGEIKAYGERVKIDKNKRMIPGVGLEKVKFKKNESLINTAILIAYLKKTYSGQCKNNEPFHLTGNWQGDINVNTTSGDVEGADGTGNAGRIVGVSAAGIAAIVSGIYGGLPAAAIVGTAGGVVGYAAGYAFDSNNIMHDCMPEIDDEFGKKSLGAYLNSMDCWQARNQSAEDITESPIKQEIVECMETIQQTSQELPSRGGRRKIDAIQDPNDEKKYTIKAYGRDFSTEITGDLGNRKIKILGISGGNPTIKTNMERSGMSNLELPLKEGIYMSCFIGFLLDNFHHKGNEHPRFEYRSRGLGFKKGIYFSDDWLDTYALTADKFKERMPTLFMEQNRENFLKFLNDGIMDEQNVSIWKEP